MEITREILQERLDGMTQQLGKLLEGTAQVQGALDFANGLMQYLEVPEPQEPEAPEPDPAGVLDPPESDDGADSPNED